MKRKVLTTLVCTTILLFTTAFPAMANTKTDEIGAATTIYQDYIINGATGELQIKSNVAGNNSEAQTYIGNVLDLSTRLMPFSLDASMTYYTNVTPTTFFVTFRNRDYNDLNQQVQAKVKEIAAQADLYQTDYEKLCFINQYLVDHCDYQSKAVSNPDQYPTAFTAYGCLIEGKAVCEGYANSVQLLCEQLGIPCMKVTGTANGGDHIWNAVYVNGKWWMLDVTFNDPIGSQNTADHWTYFLVDLDTFHQKDTHTYDDYFFEMSKEIYTGHTIGQRNVTVPFHDLSLRNASSGDVPTSVPTQEQPTEQPNEEVEEPQDSQQSTVISPETETKALALKELGLFVGDERGFRLADTMTRVEMGVMVMRMNDGIAALQGNGDHYAAICPFTDVPQWARSSIGFLYENKLVAGQSETTFGTSAVSKRDYAVMMLRVLGIHHSYEDALAIAVTHGILTEGQASGNAIATRGDIVDMTYATLQLMAEQQNHTAAQETQTPTAA